MKSILVTGGCGFIGSHTCLVLLENNFKIVVIDSLVNSSLIALERVKKLSRKSKNLYTPPTPTTLLHMFEETRLIIISDRELRRI